MKKEVIEKVKAAFTLEDADMKINMKQLTKKEIWLI
jgi:hypothetical protein